MAKYNWNKHRKNKKIKNLIPLPPGYFVDPYGIQPSVFDQTIIEHRSVNRPSIQAVAERVRQYVADPIDNMFNTEVTDNIVYANMRDGLLRAEQEGLIREWEILPQQNGPMGERLYSMRITPRHSIEMMNINITVGN